MSTVGISSLQFNPNLSAMNPWGWKGWVPLCWVWNFRISVSCAQHLLFFSYSCNGMRTHLWLCVHKCLVEWLYFFNVSDFIASVEHIANMTILFSKVFFFCGPERYRSYVLVLLEADPLYSQHCCGPPQPCLELSLSLEPGVSPRHFGVQPQTKQTKKVFLYPLDHSEKPSWISRLNEMTHLFWKHWTTNKICDLKKGWLCLKRNRI